MRKSCLDMLFVFLLIVGAEALSVKPQLRDEQRSWGHDFPTVGIKLPSCFSFFFSFPFWKDKRKFKHRSLMALQGPNRGNQLLKKKEYDHDSFSFLLESLWSFSLLSFSLTIDWWLPSTSFSYLCFLLFFFKKKKTQEKEEEANNR